MAWQAQDDNPFADPSVSAARSGAGASTQAGGSDAPAWLRGSGGSAAPPPPPPPPQGQPSTAAQPSSAPAAAPAAAPARSPLNGGDVPKMVLYMRVANLCLSVLLAATAVSTLITLPDLSAGVLAVYLFMFSCLLCCFETHLSAVAKTIASNFGFLYNYKGRAIFLMFVGIICFSFGPILGYISGILMIANSIYNFYVVFRWPEVEEAQQRKDLESDGRDFLRNNQESIARAGVDYARNNPAQASQAARAAATYV